MPTVALLLVLAQVSPLVTAAQASKEYASGPWVDHYIAVPLGSEAPDVVASQWYNSTPTSLHAHRGQIVIIEFWTVWCRGCPTQLQKLEQLASESRPGLAILTVHSTDDAERVSAFLHQRHITLPVAIDKDGVTLSQFGIQAFPACVVIDRNGHVLYKHMRSPTSAELDVLMK